MNRYRLKFTINALSMLEDILKKPFGDVVLSFSSGRISITDLRALVYVGIVGGNNVGKSFTLKDAGDYIDEVGLQTISEDVLKAFTEAFAPSQNERDEQDEAGDPEKN